MREQGNENGVVLVVVVCFAAITALLAIGLIAESSMQLKMAGKKTDMEQAFYIAEGGAERAVGYIRQGGVIPCTITGMIGGGRFYTSIIGSSDETASGVTHTVAGNININPNNSAQNQFMMLTANGITYSRQDLHSNTLDYAGTACLVHVKPKGNSDQSITVDGAAFTLDKNQAYTFSGSLMNVVLTNDNRNPHGKAVGKWWIAINGSNVSFVADADPDSGINRYYTIYSIGTKNQTKRLVVLEGVHQQSWAKYAMYYNRGPGAIWIVGGERFNGPVHANTYIYIKEDPVFNALVSSTEGSWGSGSDISQAQFNDGYILNAPNVPMASVNFTTLLAQASMIMTGVTSFTLSDSNLVVNNSFRGWSNFSMPVPSNGLIYVKNAPSGGTSSTRTGDVEVAGVLDGRLTIVAENNIMITNHVFYALHPTNGSDDALGLVAKRDVIIKNNAPTNLLVFAHIIADGRATSSTNDGSFYVQDHTTRWNCGPLNVYGGIVQFYRGAVGTVSGYGYSKNYDFDQRFLLNPPPFYPALTNEYQWKGWRESAL